jgi:ATP-dependent Clp protease protease subunit
MQDLIVNGEMILSGTVGSMFFEEGFTYVDVIMALPRVTGDLTVRLNSGGGIATEGVAIFNALRQFKGRKTIFIEGIAASAASIIAMAGDEIIMNQGSLMMIHDPLVYAEGNAGDMEKVIEALNVMGDAMAAIYAERAGRTAEEIRTEMKEELWLSAEQAVAKGYATKIADAAAKEVMAFDYRAYMKTPESILAMSDQRLWSNRLKAKAPTVTQQETPQMTTPAPQASTITPEAATKTEQDRVLGILTACNTAGVGSMAAALIRDGLTLEQATARITAESDRVKAIRAKVETARKIAPKIDAALADQFIASGSSLEAVSDDLMNRIAAMSAAAPQRSSHNATDPTDQPHVAASWDKIVAKINTQRGFNA